ncbi:hypothetical protein [Loktanella sp. 3ANDIMAR09]|uniref:hypothetical protein n=1 Tax=Loktanella sp. 3ANDIMAR09 TaxID=1225657 RepID=UPI000AC83990|nr:hypothetical protein [Loktanella sp. 3ANDIMAR09]
MSEALNALITFTGIVLSFAGVGLTFITFFAPGVIQSLALKNPKRWMHVPSQTDGNETYRHKIYSGFTIEVGYSDPVHRNDYFEPWMNALYRPDKSATSYYVTLFFNGLPMDRLLFLQYDGSRNFIPAPLIKQVGERLYASFSLRQKQFADIVGSDHFRRSFDEVAASITGSKYNPILLSHYDENLNEHLSALNEKIEDFKSRISSYEI